MTKTEPQLIIPFAKPSGMTSFTSLWQVKRCLGTKKVGHTGTLDGFADGLLVLLSGKLTKLVSYITDFDKTYLVLFYFGKETDTLDPEGMVIDEKPLPHYAAFLSALARLTGTIEQIPPAYSAVKQEGERLSDKVRRGETVNIPPRTVTIYDIQIQKIFYEDGRSAVPVCGAPLPGMEHYADKPVSGAVLQVHCSKGTYIRSLVRDIARLCGSAAYVSALRRIAVGPFTLEQAAGAELLPPFGTDAVRCFGADPCADAAPEERTAAETLPAGAIEHTALPLTADIAAAMRFGAAVLHEEYYPAFITGKPIERQWFTGADTAPAGGIIAVFYRGVCAGLIRQHGRRFTYEAVFAVPE
ncbi:MAG: tRNA pseudouridine(55) synthase TruB [Treponema sp.]